MGKKRTLAQELAELSSTAPTSFDPEAQGYGDGTDAVLKPYGDEDADDAYDDEVHLGDSRSSLRMAADMEAVGQAYASKRVARKDLIAAKEESDASSESDDEDNELEEDSDVAQQDAQYLLESGSSGSDDSDHEGKATAGAVGRDDDDSDDDDDDDTESLLSTHQSSVFASLDSAEVDNFVDAEISKLSAQDSAAREARAASTQTEQARAAEALRQRQWWDRALEVRILLQRLLDLAATAPAPQHLPLYTAADPALEQTLSRAAAAADSLARDLSTVRKGHMRQTVLSSSNEAAVAPVQEGASSAEVWDDAAADYELCKGWWIKTVDRWQRRTQVVSPALQKKLKSVNQGVWAQVAASMADKERAKRKLYMLRSDTDAACGRFLEPPPPDSASEAAAAEDSDEESGHTDAVRAAGSSASSSRASRWRFDPVDPEVLDDRELYQHLLKEFVDGGAAAGSSAAAAGAARLRQRKRRKVDTRASKGRKLRYEPHAKLQNFTFPQEYGAPPMDADELFASLFGQSRMR